MQYTTTGNLEQQADRKPARTPEMAANLAACAQFGITEPVASELSAREWVNPEYIAAHMQGLADWDTRGLAVVRMRAGEDPPEWAGRGRESHRARPGLRTELGRRPASLGERPARSARVSDRAANWTVGLTWGLLPTSPAANGGP